MAHELHDAFLLKRGVDQLKHIRAHELHFAQQLRAKENREPTDYEMQDIANMLNQRGVAPVPDSVTKLAQQKTGQSSDRLNSNR